MQFTTPVQKDTPAFVRTSTSAFVLSTLGLVLSIAYGHTPGVRRPAAVGGAAQGGEGGVLPLSSFAFATDVRYSHSLGGLT
eukprot:2460097-Rhodomonas_salina.1